MQRRSQQARMTHPYECHLPVLRYEYISRRSAVSCSCLRAACRWVVTLDRRRVSRSRSHGRCPASQRICACNAGREDQEALSLRALPASGKIATHHVRARQRPAGRPAAFLGWYGGRGHVACRGARAARGACLPARAVVCVVSASSVDPSVLYAPGG
jgi:hypothetical protein